MADAPGSIFNSLNCQIMPVASIKQWIDDNTEQSSDKAASQFQTT